MSLRADALGKALALDGEVIHLSGPLVPIPEGMVEEALAVMGTCCYGVAVDNDPGCCTCWEPIFDLVQQECATWMRPETRVRCCHDCAYRRGSPERSGDEHLAEALLDLPSKDGRVFVCHQGMRRVVSWRHPCGLVIPAEAGDYQPPQVDGVAFRADGTPADLCAGWAALR